MIFLIGACISSKTWWPSFALLRRQSRFGLHRFGQVGGWAGRVPRSKFSDEIAFAAHSHHLDSSRSLHADESQKDRHTYSTTSTGATSSLLYAVGPWVGFLRSYVCTHACMHACLHVWLYVCLYVCMYVCLHVCMSVCM